MPYYDEFSDAPCGFFISPHEIFQPKASTFTPVEKELFKLLLIQHMGTEPEDDAWTISIDDYDWKVSWTCEYGIDGYNYCSEDEYSISLALSVGVFPPQESQYQRINDSSSLLYLHATAPYLARLYRLVEHLFSHASMVWVKDNGCYDDPRNQLRHVWVDLEILFEDLYQTGKNIHLHYIDAKLSPF